jgi:hypothetical protein
LGGAYWTSIQNYRFLRRKLPQPFVARDLVIKEHESIRFSARTASSGENYT